MEVPDLGRPSPWPLGRSALFNILGTSLAEVVHMCTTHHLEAPGRKKEIRKSIKR
jgi:hypothetical protein